MKPVFLRRLLVIAGLSFCCGFTQAATAPFVARYAMEVGGGEVARMVLAQELPSAGRYRLTQRVEPGPLAAMMGESATEEASEGNWQGGMPRPEHYTLTEPERPEKAITLQFDRTTGRITGQSEDRAVDLPYTDGTVDLLSQHLAVMQRLAAGERDFTITAVKRHKLRVYRHRVLDETTIESPRGTLKALRILREAEGDDESVTLWCSEALAWLPLRMERGSGKTARVVTLLEIEGL